LEKSFSHAPIKKLTRLFEVKATTPRLDSRDSGVVILSCSMSSEVRDKSALSSSCHYFCCSPAGVELFLIIIVKYATLTHRLRYVPICAKVHKYPYSILNMDICVPPCGTYRRSPVYNPRTVRTKMCFGTQIPVQYQICIFVYHHAYQRLPARNARPQATVCTNMW
jgi:hypothetical protein